MYPTKSLRGLPQILAAVAIGFASSGALAEPITTLIRGGEVIPGVGEVLAVNNLAVNNSGEWLVEVEPPPVPPKFLAMPALIKNGAVFLKFGDPVSGPPGATLRSFENFNLNSAADVGMNVQRDNAGATAVYFNTTLVRQQSDISIAPEFSPNTVYLGMGAAKLNDLNVMGMLAVVNDPGIPGSSEWALVRAQLSGSGQVLSENVVVKEGDILPGHDQPFLEPNEAGNQWAINNSGSVMFVMRGAGDPATDGAVYRDATLLAREGSPSPIPGRNWLTLSGGDSNGSRVDLNNSGDYVYTGTLNGNTFTDSVIIKNGTKFVQEGDTLPAIGGVFAFENFGTSGSTYIDDNGNVLWFGNWSDPDTTKDQGLFLNDQLIVQEGVTMIEGHLLQSFTPFGLNNSFRMSDDGQWIIFKGKLVGDTAESAFLLDVSAIPEPSSLSLTGLSALGLLRRRLRRRNP